MRLRLVLAALLGAATATAFHQRRGPAPRRFNPDGPYRHDPAGFYYPIDAPDVHIYPPGGLADYVRDGTLVRPTSCSVVGCTLPGHYAAAADDTPITWGD